MLFQRFLSKVRDIAGRSSHIGQTLEAWLDVWPDCPVPGYASAKDLWDSELGQALRNPRVPVHDEGSDPDVAVPSGAENVLDAVSFERMVTLAESALIIRPCEGRILVDLYYGRATIEEIASGLIMQDLLGPDAEPTRRAVLDHLRKVVTRVRGHADQASDHANSAIRPAFIPIRKGVPSPVE